MPKNSTTANFRHPFSKSWLRHCLKKFTNFVFSLTYLLSTPLHMESIILEILEHLITRQAEYLPHFAEDFKVSFGSSQTFWMLGMVLNNKKNVFGNLSIVSFPTLLDYRTMLSNMGHFFNNQDFHGLRVANVL